MEYSNKKVAYLCMEFALDNTLKTYAGGLGILAGDYIKGAKDHDYPVVGIGIKWSDVSDWATICWELVFVVEEHEWEVDFSSEFLLLLEEFIESCDGRLG